MAIILRQTKGSELTFAEVDGNFSSLFYSASLQGTFLNFYTWENNLSQSFDLSNLPGFGGVTVLDGGTPIVPVATGLNFIGSGVTVTNFGGGQANIEFTGGGDTYTLTAGTKSGTSVPLNLDAAAGVDSTVNLTEGTGITLTQTSATEITIDSNANVSFTNATPTPQNFPGNSPFDNISTGTTFSNKTFTEMMNMMLYPELFPSLTNPSQTNFTLSPSGFREIGEQFAIGGITLSSTFSRGSINPAYGTNGFRSGLPNAYIYTGPGSVLTPQSSTSLTNSTATTAVYTIVQGAQSWTSRVAYDAGQQPLSSTGNNFNSPLPAGQTNNNLTRTITGVYPVFATTVNISTLTKQGLQSMTSNITVDVVTESGGGGAKQTIDIPQAFSTITGLQQFNTLSNVFDNINLATFTVTSVTKTIQGVSNIPYDRYTHNGSVIGARKLRFLT